MRALCRTTRQLGSAIDHCLDIVHVDRLHCDAIRASVLAGYGIPANGLIMV